MGQGILPTIQPPWRWKVHMCTCVYVWDGGGGGGGGGGGYAVIKCTMLYRSYLEGGTFPPIRLLCTHTNV